jgi:hypothetical protein
MTDSNDRSERRDELDLDAETMSDLEVPENQGKDVVGGSMHPVCSNVAGCKAPK